MSALQRGETIICDGGMGSMLQAQGLSAGTLPDLWNVERPEALRNVHRAYLEAGAQIATANTFGGTRMRAAGLAGRVAELTLAGLALAREVVGERAWVAADISPTGHLLEPLGDLSVAGAEEIFAEQMDAVAQSDADLIMIETFTDLEEALCAVRMAKAHTTLPVFCSFAFNPKGRTMMGLRPAVAAESLQEAGADAVGANCGDGPAAILAALQGMQGATTLPLIAQANAGIPRAEGEGQTVWDVTPEQLAEHARAFQSLGARIIGGCCGTTPAHIAAIAQALRK